jgi:hypothetical protein
MYSEAQKAAEENFLEKKAEQHLPQEQKNQQQQHLPVKKMYSQA